MLVGIGLNLFASFVLLPLSFTYGFSIAGVFTGISIGWLVFAHIARFGRFFCAGNRRPGVG